MNVKIFTRQKLETKNDFEKRINKFKNKVFVQDLMELEEDKRENLPALTVVFYSNQPKTLKQFRPNIETRGAYNG
ncbi:hypothetical protein EVU91_07270 [Macrococcoides bohemicum]|uniref:hypothetical protein n=1 Tax=Macrococcoides bohemicum TaxID=1903056 RepID=UPI0010598885|nr:hypothetical protein [Macrococcus bohemicus]TDL37704.1 hypothetical protein EVU91_07270 [Macrococcus bohemicus]